MKKKAIAFILGNICASALFAVIASICIDMVEMFGFRHYLHELPFFFAIHFVFFLIVIARWLLWPPTWLIIKDMNFLDYFWMPFGMFFISTVVAACILVGIEWKENQPLIRYSVISTLFALGVPLFFYWCKLSELPKDKTNQPQPGDGIND